jgi:hypothetical protein
MSQSSNNEPFNKDDAFDKFFGGGQGERASDAIKPAKLPKGREGAVSYGIQRDLAITQTNSGVFNRNIGLPSPNFVRGSV